MAGYIQRQISGKIKDATKFFPVIVVTGPRQSGKTTLCKHLFPDFEYCNLEDISVRETALSDMKGFLDRCGRRVIFDEAQRIPELFSYIQVRVDLDKDYHYVLTGSSNFSLLQSITQSLSGRAAIFTLLPFSLQESGSFKNNDTDLILCNGLYPGTVSVGIPSDLFYSNYYSTYVERDVRLLVNIRNLDLFQRFIRLCAGRVGNEFNASSIAGEVGVSSTTIQEWLTILEASYIVFKLPPYYENIGKRLVRKPKIYFYDTGIICFLLGIESAGQLAVHPLRGHIFENLAVSEILKRRINENKPENLFFYKENSGKEVDIMQVDGKGGFSLYEVKSSKTYTREYEKGLRYLETLFKGRISGTAVIYDGDSFPPHILNIRDL